MKIFGNDPEGQKRYSPAVCAGCEKHEIISRIARHQTVDFYPFSLVEHGQITIGELATSLALSQQLIGVCLLLVAVLYLSKTNSPNDVHTAG